MTRSKKEQQRISALELGLIGALLFATLIGGAGVLGIDMVTAFMG